MYFLKSVIIFCLCSSVTMDKRRNSAPGSIGFPESEEDPALSNKDQRHPVYIPSTCPTDELYYPGDQKDDWICDCRPAFLYHPKTDRCWPAYRIGPCQIGNYLVLGQESAIPFCVENPCIRDGMVMYNGKCEALGSSAPCHSPWPFLERVTINSTTLTVSCEPLVIIEKRFKVEPCPPGSKRYINGKCSPPTSTIAP